MDGGSWDAAVQSRRTSSNVSSVESTEDILKNKQWVTYHKLEWKQLTHLSML